MASTKATIELKNQQQIKQLIQQATRDPAIASKLADLFDPAKIWPDLDYLQPFKLADTWKIDRRAVLESFIRTSQVGLFTLHWQSHCPHCENISGHHAVISNIKTTQQCSVCSRNYENSLDETVEVSFSVTPKYRPTGGFKPVATLLKAKPESLPNPVKTNPQQRVTGKDCLLLPAFREVFKDQTLSEHQSLNIRHITLLFTDIVGSTAIYHEFGDIPAFKAVQNHFEILRGAVERHQGVIVKTIGDAVMAVFHDEAQAVAAAMEALNEFPYNHPDQKFQFDIKLGIHSGSTIAVNLNDQIDYFGTTVNLAARIQGLARGGELVLSEAVFNRWQDVNPALDLAQFVQQESVLVKGLLSAVAIYRINVAALRGSVEGGRIGLFNLV